MIEIVHTEAVHDLPIPLFRINRFVDSASAYNEAVPKFTELALAWIDQDLPLSPPDPNNFTVRPQPGVDLDACEAKLKETFPMSEVTRTSTIFAFPNKALWMSGHIDYDVLNMAIRETGEYRETIRVTNRSKHPAAPSLVRVTQLGDVQIVRTTSGEEKRINVSKNPFCPVYLRIQPDKSVDVTVVWLSTEERHKLGTCVMLEINKQGYAFEIVEDIACVPA